MARVAINTGASANDGTGDNLRAAGGILNNNFLELYTYLGAGSTTTLSAPVWSTTNAGIHTLRNVGIGTTNPRFVLEVGAVGASGTTLFVNGNARVTGIVTIGPASITLNGIANIINVGTGITLNGSTGSISATEIVLGGTTLTGAGVTSITAGSGISINQSTGNVTITATGGGGSSQFVTTAAGIHTLSNVGIGTTNPTSKLTVSGDVKVTGVVTATTFIGALTGTATTATNAQGLTGTPNIAVGVATASILNVGTSGTVITTTTAGLVGIGTTNPTSALTVVGASGTTLLVTGGTIPIQIGGNEVSGTIFKVGQINLSGPNASDVNSTYYSNILYQKVGDFRYNLEFHSGGYTGYGGAAPAGGPGDFIFYKRDISYGRAERFRISGETGDITSQGGVIAASTNVSGIATASRLNVGTGGTVITTTTVGLVGIGTTNPTSALTVSGDVKVTGVVTATTFIGNLTGTATSAGIATYTSEWILGQNASSDYTFTGPGLIGAENDPVLYLVRGQQYKFTNTMGAHPFRIQSTVNGSTGTQYNDGITNNDVSNGTLTWNVQFDAPNILYYQCTAHGSMGGKIYIIDAGIGPDISINTTGIITATSFFGNGSGLTGIIGSGSGVIIKDSGSTVGTAGTIDFGDNLTVSAISAGIVTVTGSASGGSSQFVTTAAGIHTLSNVGIGTTNPTSKLTVSGDALINGITVGRGSSAVASNTAIGYQSLYNNTYGLFNVANGYYTLRYNTDGTHNTANGYYALYNNTTGDYNTATGSSALAFLDSGNNNTATGFGALNETTGSSNTGFGKASGSLITTGSKNTILGTYDGNQNGLDIRTSNNNVVLSDGDGNIRFYANSSGNVGIGTTNPTSKLTVSGDVLVSGVSTFRDYLDINNPSSSSSSLRLHNVSLLSAATNFTKLSANAAALAPEIGGGYAPLHLRSNNEITLQSVTDSSPVVYAGFTTTSSYLNYLGATKLQTLGTGITVTGTTFTNQLSVSGVVTATSFFGNGSGLTGVIGSGSGVIIKDSGSTVGTAGTIDFGDNLTVSAISAGIVTVTGSFQFVTTAAGIHTLSNVGIGTTNPTSALTVTGSISVDSGITIGRGGGSFPANIAIGPSALFYNTTGQRNTGVGWQALQSNTTGEDNVANGYRALFANTTGLANVAIGSSSLQNNTTGLGNVAVGTRALYTNTTGNFNTATGVSALFYNTTGNKNTANGNSALISNTTGNNNTATGVSALKSNTTGSDNVAIGGSSLYSNTTGIENTATGYLALFANTTGNNNTANGNSALQSNTTGSYNTGIGWQALESNITANSNTGIGYRSLFENRYGSQNVAIGMQSLFAVDGGSYNTATGNSALAFVVSGTNNTATGYAALNETTGSSNSGFGYLSGSLITTGSKNTILGSYTGNQNGLDIRTLNNNVVLSDGDGNIRFYANSSGNVGIGTTNPQGTLQVGTGITMYGSTGIISATTFVGNFSGSITNATNLTGGYANASQLNVSGVATISQGRIQADGSSNLRFGNIAAGSGSGRNIAIGDQVLYSLSGGQGRNIGIGELSYYDTTSGQYNIGLGIQAGQKITTGNYNVILGGYDGQTGLDLRTSSNNVVIADGQGNIRQYINSSGNVGIKTTVITEALTVAGIVSATSFYGTLNAGQLTGSLPAINGSALIGVVGSGSGVIIQGNGTPVGTAGTINFASNLNVTFASGIATVSGASSVSSATTAFNLAGSPNVTLGSVLAGVSTFNAGNVYITGGVNFESSFVNISGAGFVGWRRIGNLGQGQLELVSGTYLDPTRVSPLKIRSNTSIELGSIGVDGTTYVSDIAYAGFSSTSSYLNHNNSKKFETTGYGVSIYGGINAPTGIITASSFSGSGSGLTNLPAAQLTGTLPAIDGSALLNVTAAGTGIAIRDDNSNIGSATTVNFGTGLDVTFSAGIATITASGGSLQSRTTVSGVTTSIANNGIGNTNITGFKSYGLMKVGLSTAGWLRLYTDSTSRTNDISRSVGEDPAPGSGVIAEVVTTGITTTQIISPFVMGGNLDNSPTTTIYAAIKNLSGSTQAITANLTILQLEA